MWRLRGKCSRCDLPLFMHFFIWLQSIGWRLLGRDNAEGERVVLIKKALEFYDQAGPPLVVEPLYRKNSRHSTGNILTRSDLVQAFYTAQDVSPWVVLRKEISGVGNSSTSSVNNGFK